MENRRFRRGRLCAAMVLTALGMALAFLLNACGGGGGGGQSGTPVGRSYQFASNGQAFVMTTDATGRFTVFEEHPGSAASGGQGTIGTNGQFVAHSDDGALDYNGTVATDGSSVSGAVRQNGQTVFSFTAAAVDPGRATPGGLSGSYYATDGATTVALSIDPTSNGTLWVKSAAGFGGGHVVLTDNGVFQTTDSSTQGQLINNGSGYTLQITKLNGAAASISLVINSTRAKWTFLVYLNAANNLEEFGPLNVNQMEKTGSTSDVNIVVQWKRAVCSDCGTPDWTGTRRYFITKDPDTTTVHSQLVQDMGQNVDMGDWRELRNFIAWTQQRYPADHYALVIWNHGAGWRPTRASRSPYDILHRAVSIDDSTNNEIETWQLPQALDVSPHVDMLVFDASLMQMTEVAYEIRNSTGIVVGSEESPPGEGYIYNSFLNELTANPGMSAAQLATSIVSDTLASPPTGYGTSNNLTQSAIDLSKMQPLADSLSAFASSLLIHATDSKTAVTDARNNAQSYAYPDNKDLWDYANIVKTETTASDLQAAATNLQQAISGALIAEKHGTVNGKSHGIAVYVPASSNYLSAYANLALAKVTNWPRWLQSQP